MIDLKTAVEKLNGIAEVCDNVGDAIHFHGTSKDDLALAIRTVLSELSRAHEDSVRLDEFERHPVPTEIRGGPLDGTTSKAWALACDSKFTLRQAIDSIYLKKS